MGSVPAGTFELVFDQTAHPFVAIKSDGTILYASSSIDQVLGWTADQVVGHNMVEFLHPGSIDDALDAVDELARSEVLGTAVPMVFEVIRPDGTSSWTEVGALPISPDLIVLRHRSWDGQHHFDQFITSLLTAEPLESVCAELSRSIAANLHAGGAAVHHGFDGRSFVAAAGAGVPEQCLLPAAGPWHRAVITGRPTHASVDELPEPAASAAREAGYLACWTQPVPIVEGLAPAVLSVWRGESNDPLLGHRKVLERSSRYVQLALLRWSEHQRLTHLAGHDALTGVANRTLFRDRLAQALAIGEREFAVAFCDLDGFKAINDTYGHQTGDEVLVAVAERLRASLRTGDELARIGGDEFTAILRNVPDPAAALHVAERLLASTQEPLIAGRRLVRVGISIGIAMVRPDASADTLIGLADTALYQVKRAGGGAATVVAADDSPGLWPGEHATGA